MNNVVAGKLLQLNAEFYQTFASQFSDTRQRIQPGVQQILDSLDTSARILDLGCGNGSLALNLAQRGFTGQYLGLDQSIDLLDVAEKGVKNHPNFSFGQIDIADPDWCIRIDEQQSIFDIIFSFAVLHHIPGQDNQLQILQNIRKLLSLDGRFVHSNWQFLNSERLRKRIQPWEEIELSESDIDPGDYLLDWRRGGFGLRYVHHFSEEELTRLATSSGFRIVESFYADGETGNLGLYQIWETDERC